jgi:hypothetical protein
VGHVRVKQERKVCVASSCETKMYDQRECREWMGKVFLGCHMVWLGSLVGVRLASASITLESLTCVGKTESLQNQDARPRGVHGMGGEGFLVG